MFCIAICDDDISICSQIEKCLERYIKEKKIQIEIYSNSEIFYQDLCDGQHYDLVFLDIEFPKVSGIDIGVKIRNELNDEKMHIVYISGREDHAMKLFAVRPLHFLIKPFTQSQLCDVLEKAMALSKTYYDCFDFQVEQTHYRCFYSDIIYFESCARKVIVHTLKKDYECYGKLDNIEIKTQEHFLRVHKSYLVNPLYVIEYKLNTVTLVNEKPLPISQPYRKKVRCKLLKSWGEK